METEQIKQIEQINKLENKLTPIKIDYWQQYSSLHSWEFWFLLTVLVLSLICLYLFIDRKKALQIGFFGFNIHVWLNYLDEIAIYNELWSFPYKLIPYLPVFTFEASFVPVVFMFVYQWTINHDKNYYLYATGLCLILAFVWRPLLSTVDLFQVKNGINYLYVILGYLIVMVMSKWITNIFVHFEKEKKST
ncbi:hypothetical protein GCM10009001_21170 [Virgibacillus siamensis]|uniref:Uncharacterized protein n=1 Tax=Virgibacillus siamensis TaxID=480071 RepID=A0ABN1G4C9_9BACI